MSLSLSLARPLLALLAAGLFAGFGIHESWPARALIPEPRYGPLAALEKHADYGAGRSSVLPELSAALDRLPPGKPLLVFQVADNERASSAVLAVDYLAWPRRAERKLLVAGGPGENFARLREQYAGIVLCGARAPANYPDVQRLGPGLEILPGREAAAP